VAGGEMYDDENGEKRLFRMAKEALKASGLSSEKFQIDPAELIFIAQQDMMHVSCTNEQDASDKILDIILSSVRRLAIEGLYKQGYVVYAVAEDGEVVAKSTPLGIREAREEIDKFFHRSASDETGGSE
jgi:hypothetical protein